jgi:hypothetical protein
MNHINLHYIKSQTLQIITLTKNQQISTYLAEFIN